MEFWYDRTALFLSMQLIFRTAKFQNIHVITGRNEVVAKVMLLLVSVILLTGGRCLPQCMLGYHTPPPESRHPPGADNPPPREADSGIWSMSGRYASYWNAFLYNCAFPKISQVSLSRTLSFSFVPELRCVRT